MEDKQFLTKIKFAKLVEECVIKNKMTYIEAIIALCDEHEVELEEVRKFISPVIKDKVEAEAQNLNFLPRQNALPID
jgi:hypothetical protein